MTIEQRRANEQDRAILIMEAALAKLTREQSDSADDEQQLEEEYNRRKAEMKKGADSRTASYAVASADLIEIRAAHSAGTVPVLLPVPLTYTPPAPTKSLTHRESMSAAAARAPYTPLRSHSDPATAQHAWSAVFPS